MAKGIEKALEKAIMQSIDSINNDVDFKEKLLTEHVAPILKEAMQQRIKKDIVDKDFVDQNGEYRKYYGFYRDKKGRLRVSWNPRTLGRGRTQKQKYAPMMDENHIIAEVLSPETVRIYNDFAPPPSIFGTPIQNLSDPLLYTKWIVNGDIVMPTLEMMGKEQWKRYCENKENRYEAREYVDNTLNDLKKATNAQRVRKVLRDETMKEILKRTKGKI